MRYLPRVAEIPVGATSASQVVLKRFPTMLPNVLNDPSLPTAKEIAASDAAGRRFLDAVVPVLKADGMLPTITDRPMLIMMGAADLKGTMSQENPTSPPPSCPYGYDSGPTWSGWDAVGWQYVCAPPPPPPPPPAGNGGGPVLCQGNYCIQPDGTITETVIGPFGTTQRPVQGYQATVSSNGDIVVRGPGNELVATYTGTNAAMVRGVGIVAQSAVGGVSTPSGQSPVSSQQITTNITRLNSNGDVASNTVVALGGGYTLSTSRDGGNDMICDAQGNCSRAYRQGGQIVADMNGGRVVVDMPTKTEGDAGTSAIYATGGVQRITYTPTGSPTIDVTNVTVTPVSSGGGDIGSSTSSSGL